MAGRRAAANRIRGPQSALTDFLAVRNLVKHFPNGLLTDSIRPTTSLRPRLDRTMRVVNEKRPSRPTATTKRQLSLRIRDPNNLPRTAIGTHKKRRLVQVKSARDPKQSRKPRARLARSPRNAMTLMMTTTRITRTHWAWTCTGKPSRSQASLRTARFAASASP